MTHLPFPISFFLVGHILAGLIALITFTIPLFSKKGGKVHVRVGWVYSVSMIGVALAAFVIAFWRYFLDPTVTAETRRFALFLFFIALFALCSLQQGIHVFQYKKREGSVLTVATLGLPGALLLFSIAVFWVGVASNSMLLIIFPLIAGRTAIKQILHWKSQPALPQAWWFFHLENMFTCCIATVTAFLVTAVPRLFPSAFSRSVFLWLLPTFVMVPWMLWFKRKYEKKFALAAGKSKR